ncbi:hypothetical protein [Pontibacter sp. 172403-2]|uniref:hypothetical protein n=1 Tax=Pontibacter rufus TaxID=2791028 RepID=UPI0018AF623A|nr:hypothetical protein [Pontibacter sp. 172403-2]
MIDGERNNILNAQYFYQKLEAQNAILQIKIHSRDPVLLRDTYVDIKYLISYYIKACEERQFGYDDIDMGKIFSYTGLLSIEERLKALHYLNRLLAVNGFEPEKDACNKALADANISLCTQNITWVNAFKLLYLKMTMNIWTVAFTLLLSYSVYSIVLLPSSEPKFPVFEIEYLNVSKNFYSNHFANTLLGVFQFSDGFKVKPLNIWGVILLVLGKIAFLVIVINILIKEISSKLKL